MKIILYVAIIILFLSLIIFVIYSRQINQNKKNKKNNNVSNFRENESLPQQPSKIEEVSNQTNNNENLTKQPNTCENENIEYFKTASYKIKPLLTRVESGFYRKLDYIIKDDYLLCTQVNLATIVYNDDINVKYHNELFRNIDFVIFDKNTYLPLLAIELNDNTHEIKDRYIRDYKVKEILEKANLPIITFYTKYSNKTEYIKNRLEQNSLIFSSINYDENNKE